MDRRSLAALLLAGALGCGTPRPDCPPASAVDEARAEAVRAAAARVGPEVAGEAAICFGGEERGSVLPDGVVVISRALDEAAAAARLIHLRTHVAEDLHRFPRVGVACALQMEEAMAAEARAIAAELAACAALRCGEPPYSFADEVLAAPPDDRVGRVLARLREDPASDGLDVMLRRYRARCEAAQ